MLQREQHRHSGKALRMALLAAAVVIAVPAIVATPKAFAQETPAGIKALLGQAKQEGAVVMFTGSTRYTQDKADLLSSVFEKKYGFPMKVTLASLGPHPTIIQRVSEEFSSGIEPPVDLFPSAPALLERFNKVGAIEPVDWNALGFSKDAIIPEDHSVILNILPRTVIYNTKSVSAADAPHSIEDLANPKWKGKIVTTSIPDVIAYLAPVIGETQTYDLVRTLVQKQNLALVQSVTDITTKVINGEYAIGFGAPANITQQKEKGAPVENAPLSKVAGQPFAAVVLKKVKHPAAAKVFAYFACCTAEGQKAMYDAIGWASFNTPNTEHFEIGGHGRGIVPSLDWQLHDQIRISKQIRVILGL
jgi:iron(III) transport system substrate-binding protein